MMTRTLIALAATGLLVLFGAMAGGCKNGGGGALTLEEFFQRVEEIDGDFEARNAEIEAELEELSDEEALDQGPDLLGRLAELVGELVDELAALDPPEEATQLLEEAVSAGRNVADTFDGLVVELEDAQSLDDLFSFFEDPDFTAARERFEQVCSDLTQLAADNGITVDLYCDEDTGDGPVEEPTTASTGEPSSELEEYFADLDDAENAYREQSDAITTQISALDDTTVGQTAGLVEQSVAAINEFVAALEDIDPPEEAVEAHAEATAGFQAAADFLEGALPQIESATTMAGIDALFSTDEFTSLDASLDGACTALTSIADANGVIVDLGC